MDMIKEYLKHLKPIDALQFVKSNKYLYTYYNIFNYLMHIHYPTIHDFGQPKEQFIALANNVPHLYYTKLMHLESIKCPEMIYKYIYLNKKDVPIDDEDDNNEFEALIKVEIYGIKPPIGTTLYVSAWIDYAYGETLNTAYTVPHIIDLSLEQFKIDYDVIKEHADEFIYVDTLRDDMIHKLEIEGKYCLVLHEHPLDDDLTPSVLTIKRVNVM